MGRQDILTGQTAHTPLRFVATGHYLVIVHPTYLAGVCKRGWYRRDAKIWPAFSKRFYPVGLLDNGTLVRKPPRLAQISPTIDGSGIKCRQTS